MPDLSVALPAELEVKLLRVIDAEGKLIAALEALGPVAGREVVVLDSGRGYRARQLAEIGASVTAVQFPVTDDVLSDLVLRPSGGPDVVVAFWSELATPGSRFVSDALRLLRPGGRLLLVHDYGRDDVWGLRPETRERQVAWSHRHGPFLGAGFRVRVIHCWLSFESLEQARELLEAAFGERGIELAASMKNTRLQYNVAVYHRSAPAPDASSS